MPRIGIARCVSLSLVERPPLVRLPPVEGRAAYITGSTGRLKFVRQADAASGRFP